MKLSQLFGRRIKETPKDAQSASHIFLIRGGYVRPVSAGIYSLLPLAKRIAQKVENILRQEMNGVDGQEVLMPVVLPRELWDESGRYNNVGAELLRFKDRNGKDMLLGMTHEEAVVHLARTEISSYKQFPCMVYQIQTKYRDEGRPRAGLIRVREFTMKDAYSFHTSAECLQKYYQRVHEAYVRIFNRFGLNNVVSIESDTGMMGGRGAHEFMAIAECGEDTIFLSPDGKYKANREIACTALKFTKQTALPLEKVKTPGTKTIEDLASFLKVPSSNTCKAVFYRDGNGVFYFVSIRGDIEVNETKLRNHFRISELRYANDDEIRSIGSVPGFASPLGINPEKVKIVFDRSAAESSNLVAGANEPDYHFLNFNFDREMSAIRSKVEVIDIALAREGDPCPVTGLPLKELRGIEVGNIFQLGTKYSESMNFSYLDQDGKSKPVIMGCYGIGVGRSIAAVIEQNHDAYGPIWPISIAPFHVHICALNLQEPNVREASEQIYSGLLSRGVEVLYDDRNEKAGSAFADADLIGIPFRVIVSPKNLSAGVVELKTRNKSLEDRIPLDKAVEKVSQLIKSAAN